MDAKNKRVAANALVVFLVLSLSINAASDESGCIREDNAIILRLAAVTSITGEEVSFGSLLMPASEKCLSMSLSAQRIAVNIGQSETRISREIVEHALNEKASTDKYRYSVVGADYVLVRRKANSDVAINDVINEAKHYLHNSILTKFSVRDLKLKSLNSGARFSTIRPQPSSVIEFRWRAGAGLNSQETVWVDFKVSGAVVESLPLSFAVEGEQEVYVLSRSVYRLNHLVNELVSTDFADIKKIRGEPFSGPISNREFQFVQQFDVGQVITKEMLKAVPAVSRGGLVKVRVKNNRISLEALAVALNDGAIGERVSIKSPSSEEIFQAIVVAKGVAELNY